MASLLCAIKLKCSLVCGNTLCCVAILKKGVLHSGVFLIVLPGEGWGGGGRRGDRMFR